MGSMHQVGLDVHKKTISFRIRKADGQIIPEKVILANRQRSDPNHRIRGSDIPTQGAYAPSKA